MYVCTYPTAYMDIYSKIATKGESNRVVQVAETMATTLHQYSQRHTTTTISELNDSRNSLSVFSSATESFLRICINTRFEYRNSEMKQEFNTKNVCKRWTKALIRTPKKELLFVSRINF